MSERRWTIMEGLIKNDGYFESERQRRGRRRRRRKIRRRR